jgi:hypothetical protein
MRAKGLIGTLAVAIGVLAAPAMRASDFVGVYCLPDKVVLEPNDTEPQRAQIWGAFLMADTKTATGYLAAERGYLYYACPQGKDNACLNEWSDLKALAGTGKAAGFGGRFQPAGHLRKASDPLGSPDPYPIQFGLVKIGGDSYSMSLLSQLKAAK